MSRAKIPTTAKEFERCAELLRFAANELESLAQGMRGANVKALNCESKMLTNYSPKMVRWAMGVKTEFAQSQIESEG